MNIFRFLPVIRIRLLLQFLTTMATMSVIPFIIIFFSDQLGTFITGFLFLVVMAANVCGSILGGYISDQIGRKRVILLAEFIIFIGFIGAASVNSPWHTSPYITFSLFIFIQFSTGAATPVYQALIVDVSQPDNRKMIYTYAYWLRNMAAAIGSMIGAFLFHNYHFYLFIGVALCTLISLLITFFYIQETYIPITEKAVMKNGLQGKKQPLQILQTYKNVLAHKFFFTFTIAALLIVSVEEQLTNYIGVRLVNKINEPVQLLPLFSLQVDGMNLVGMLKTTNTLIVVFCTMLIARIIKRWNEQFVLLTGLCLFFIGYTIISYSTFPFLLMIAMVIASIGEMMYAPIQQTMLANTVPNHKRSSYMAIYTIAVFLGVSTAGVFLIISSWLPPIVLTIMMAVMGLISTGLLFRLTEREKSPIETGKSLIEARSRRSKAKSR
ncbi:MFS transporter [Virgibacillus dakarensis]|nr:MFS transporter [Virgibacillus dakarensis]MBT2216769.1 MFS transporter [Virgibacillus dakarensis]